MNGILPLIKFPGITSFDVIRRARKILGIKKIGHAGTLDKAASGVLVLGIGYGTRILKHLESEDKIYLAEFRFGFSTDTDDDTGDILEKKDASFVTSLKIEDELKKFIGEIDQLPPKYSALKLDGKRASDLARAGKEVKLNSRKVNVFNLELLDYSLETQIAKVRIHCSKGTYVRSLARDIGNNLTCLAHAANIVREKSGGISISDCFNYNLDLFTAENKDDIKNKMLDKLISVDSDFIGLQSFEIDYENALKLNNGMICKIDNFTEVLTSNSAIIKYDNKPFFLANVELVEDSLLIKPDRLLERVLN